MFWRVLCCLASDAWTEVVSFFLSVLQCYLFCSLGPGGHLWHEPGVPTGVTPLYPGIVLPGSSKLEYANKTQVHKKKVPVRSLLHVTRKVHVPNCILSAKDKVKVWRWLEWIISKLKWVHLLQFTYHTFEIQWPRNYCVEKWWREKPRSIWFHYVICHFLL